MRMPFERHQALEALAKEVSTTDLSRILKRMPHILFEAVRELDGKVAYRTISPEELAKEAIENEDVVCFDVASKFGQMFDNVKHMTWFVDAIVKEMSERT